MLTQDKKYDDDDGLGIRVTSPTYLHEGNSTLMNVDGGNSTEEEDDSDEDSSGSRTFIDESSDEEELDEDER